MTKILVATDFSEHAERATRHALQLARKLEARVELFHTWSLPIVSYPDITVTLPTQTTLDLGNDAQKAMKAALERHATPGVTLTGTVTCGDPTDAVIEAAEKTKADMLVVGTHGRRGLKRALLGSVAETIVRHAPCPVLVVR